MRVYQSLILVALGASSVTAMAAGGEQPLASRASPEVSLSASSASPADLDALRAELRALRTEVAELRRQLARVRDRPEPAAPSALPLSAAKPDPTPAVVSLKDVPRHSLGRPDAPLVLVEF